MENNSLNTPKKNSHPDGKPHFGRLLAVLILAVFIITIITWLSEMYWE